MTTRDNDKGILETFLSMVDRLNDTNRLIMDRLDIIEKRIDERLAELEGIQE